LSTIDCHRLAAKRNARTFRALFIAFIVAVSFIARAQTPVAVPSIETAPPPAVSQKQEAGVRSFLGRDAAAQEEAPAIFVPASATQYEIGDPTPEEQLYLELANRARLNPPAEAQIWRTTTDPDVLSSYGYFGVNLPLMVSQISLLAPVQPLSFHPQLLAAARRHTMDMYVNDFQSHIGRDGSNPGMRLNAAGYSWNTYGENAFATARSVVHGHAGFEVDWGAGPGGMQTPAGHRINIHNGNFREAGIGVTNGLRDSVGPQIVTEEFANRWGITPFITGVVYYDFNGNRFYDIGEGIGGVRVDVPGSTYFAVTANSGGYSVPVQTNGAYAVTFSGPNLTPTTLNVTIADGLNSKLDYVPIYTAPVLNGPATVMVGRANNYTFNSVGGATAYQWKHAKRINSTSIEGAESGTNNVSLLVSTNYAVIQNAVKASGSYAFQLAHPQPVDQFLALNWLVRPGPNGQLAFASRLGWATSNQIARVQVTTNSGATWQELWSRTNDNTAGQTAFARVTNSLAPFSGREISVRFVYDHFGGGSYYPQSGAGMGWYLDDIGFNNCEQLVSPQVNDVSNTAFAFVPSEAASYSLRVRARVGSGYLDWGPPALPSVAMGIAVRISSMPVIANNRATFNFRVESGNPSSFTVESSPNPRGPWVRDTTASIATVTAGSLYRATCATSPSGRCFYRIVAR